VWVRGAGCGAWGVGCGARGVRRQVSDFGFGVQDVERAA
jgi:hypothetical protein